MRRLGVVLLVIAILFSLFPTTSVLGYSGGSGTPDDPYWIATAQDLIDLGNEPNDYDKHFVLTEDIDLDPNLPGGQVFTQAVIAPGSYTKDWLFSGDAFQGVFNGNGHIIYNLTIEGEAVVGLFGCLGSGARISDLGLEQAQITGRSWVGILVARNQGSVSSCHVTGSVSGYGSVGALVGSNHGSITSSYSTGLVSGYSGAGGLVGSNHGPIIASYSTGMVSGSYSVGGLVGSNSASITSSYSTGAVSGKDRVGGLVGSSILYSTITSSYSTGVVSGKDWVGGLIGSSGGSVSSSFWDIETSGQAQSDEGTGLSTTDMLNINTYLNAGWDFVDEVANGTANLWLIQDAAYPTLAVFSGLTPFEPQGSGTMEDPYLVADANELGSIWYRPGAYYRLTLDIDLSGISWNTAIIPWFNGGFDGNDHVIRYLRIDGRDQLGLIGQLSSTATISNLGLEAVDVNGTGDFVGSLVGRNDGTVTSSYSTGAVRGDRWVGGLVGDNSYTGTITLSYHSGTVNGTRYIGGLMGRSGGSIVLSYNIGAVSGKYAVGGLVGQNKEGTITTSYSSGAVSGLSRVGGLVGDNNEGSTNISYSAGEVSGDLYIGGLVGFNGGSITSNYSTGSVSGDWTVGGLVGVNHTGTITSSYSTGTVRGNFYVGGLAGREYNGTITVSFWDTEASGQTQSQGGSGLSTADMQNINTYLEAGWDLVDEVTNGTANLWQIRDGTYPTLTIFSDLIPIRLHGSGTKEDPYLLTDVNELGSICHRPNAHYRMASDMDMSGINWNKAVIPWFGGSLDGNGYVISHLSIEGSDHLGLIGQLSSSAHISNLSLEAVDVNGTGNFVGGLAGRNYGFIISSTSSGEVRGSDEVGGLVGYNYYGTLTLSNSNCEISGDDWVGGLMGRNNDGTVTSSYSDSVINGNKYVGGLVGDNDGGTIISSYSTSVVNGDEYIGGIVGNNDSGSIISNHSTGSVSGEDWVGGLVGGNSQGNITSSYSDGTIRGNDRVGGLVGNNDVGPIAASYNTSTVTGNTWVGGLVGSNDGPITASFNTGAIKGSSLVGGLTGSNSDSIIVSYNTGSVGGDSGVGGLVGGLDRGSITSCYSTGLVTGSEIVGGLVADNWVSTITVSFWATDTSGQPRSAGGTGMSTADMQDINTFLNAGWDFIDIWTMPVDDYPCLIWEIE